MKQTLVLLLAFFLVGCSYSLKTSLIQEDIVLEQVEPFLIEDCSGNDYCRLMVLSEMNDIAEYEAYTDLYPATNAQWEAFLQSKIDYAALNEESCVGIEDTDLRERCEIAVRFNAGMQGCSQESNLETCSDQHIFSRPEKHDCSSSDPSKQAFCSTALALVSNTGSHCENLTGTEKSFCQSLVTNSLYFCEDEDCANFYFERNITGSPRLTYCRFEDAGLQSSCQEKIKTWFATAHNNLLYCSTKDCYEWIIQKRLVENPYQSLQNTQEASCDHLTATTSKQRCESFVSDVYAQATGSIGACESFLCFESFKGNMLIMNESSCGSFESQLLDDGEGVFGEREELSMCLAVVDFNRALQVQNEDLCTTPDCVEAVKEEVQEIEETVQEIASEVESIEVDLHQKIDASMSEDEIEQALEQVDVEEALKEVDLNSVVDSIDVNQFKDVLNTDGSLDEVDLNEKLKDVDLNEEIRKIDMKSLLDQINIKDILPQEEE